MLPLCWIDVVMGVDLHCLECNIPWYSYYGLRVHAGDTSKGKGRMQRVGQRGLIPLHQVERFDKGRRSMVTSRDLKKLPISLSSVFGLQSLRIVL